VRSRGYKLPLVLAACGFLSGMLTCALIPSGQQGPGLYCGIVFGSFLAIPLAMSRILDWGKALALIALSTAAYFLAYIAAFWMQSTFPQIVPSSELGNMGTNEPASAIALFVGGLVGGFLVFAGVILLSRPEISKGARAPKIVQGTLLGGALGIVGWALRSFIGAAIWHVFHAVGLAPSWELSPDYSQISRMYSLYVVWQTGVAAGVGNMLRQPSAKK
jgi:hypothetical protein